MKASRAPVLPAVTKGRFELPSPRRARRSERRVSTSCTTWSATGGLFELTLGTAVDSLPNIQSPVHMKNDPCGI